MSPKADAYQVVTDKIVEALEAGHIPWEKPWRSVAGEMPTSLSTGRVYSGINMWLLSLTSFANGFTSPYWGTFRQVKELAVKAARKQGREIVEETSKGRTFYVEIVDGERVPFKGGVRKGEQGTQIVLWKKATRKVEVDGETEERSYGFLRYFTVFNADQCEGLELPETVEPEPFEPLVRAEEIVVGYMPGPTIRHGGNSACYMPGVDVVQMPVQGAFKTPEHYYSTLLHELAHSTGHESRLKRDTLLAPTPFGSEDYSKEELVAEMAAAYLSAEAGLELAIEHSAGYIQHWISVLKDDHKLLVSAAAQAQKAADCVLGL